MEDLTKRFDKVNTTLYTKRAELDMLEKERVELEKKLAEKRAEIKKRFGVEPEELQKLSQDKSNEVEANLSDLETKLGIKTKEGAA